MISVFNNMQYILGLLHTHHHYYGSFAILFIGLYAIAASTNLVRRLLGLAVFQSAIILFYISIGFVSGGSPPLLKSYKIEYIYHAPLPHVLMLTAIVVGVATLSVGLALIIRIKREHGKASVMG